MSRVVLRGRSEEIATGIGLLRRTRQSGRGAVLLIEGPAGIGKSAILAELAGQAAQLGYRCGLSKADQITGTSPATRGKLRALDPPVHRHRPPVTPGPRRTEAAHPQVASPERVMRCGPAALDSHMASRRHPPTTSTRRLDDPRRR